MRLTSRVAVSSMLAGIAAVVIIAAGIGAFYLLNAAPRTTLGSTTLSSTSSSSSSFNITISTLSSRISSNAFGTTSTTGSLGYLDIYDGTFHYKSIPADYCTSHGCQTWDFHGTFTLTIDSSTGMGSGTGQGSGTITDSGDCVGSGSVAYVFQVNGGTTGPNPNPASQISIGFGDPTHSPLKWTDDCVDPNGNHYSSQQSVTFFSVVPIQWDLPCTGHSCYSSGDTAGGYHYEITLS